jgi:DUF971 family protein
LKPRQIKIFEKTKLYIIWNDGSESKISLRYLREECPCASCKGETVLFETIRPAKVEINSPDMITIANIQTVGDYAIQIFWKDGHGSGIYSWDYLLLLEKGEADNQKHDYKPLL